MSIQKLSFITFLALCLTMPIQAIQEHDNLVLQQEMHEKKNNLKSLIKNNKKISASLFAAIVVIAGGCYIASRRPTVRSLRETELPTINDKSRTKYKPQELHTFNIQADKTVPPTLFPRDKEDSKEFEQLILSQSTFINLEEIKGGSDQNSSSTPTQMHDVKLVTPSVKAQPKIAARVQLFEDLSANNSNDSASKKVQKTISETTNTHLSLEEESSYFTMPQPVKEYSGQISKRVSSIYKNLSFRISRNKPEQAPPSEVTWTP